jgi:tetratricopeptide (TPR) repeat protein
MTTRWTDFIATCGLALALAYVASISRPPSRPAWQDFARDHEVDPLAIVLTARADSQPETPRRAEIARIQARVRAGDTRLATLERLGWAFVAEARATDDGSFYELALHCADAIEARYTDAAEGKLLRGHALHSLHRFAEAEAIARSLVAERGSPLDYALLGDALFDEGRVDDAIIAYRRLMRLRPDSAAYARVAQVRQIKGDLEGAAEALRVAARAASRRDPETYAWLWSRLADVELRVGRLAEARAAASVALDRVAEFPAAEIVVGKTHLADDRPDLALAPIERAARRTRLPEQLWLLADAYRWLGRSADAEAVEAELTARGALVDPRGLAAYLAATGRDPARALVLATAERGKRGDVYTLDTLAMARLASGDVAGAEAVMTEAAAVGTRDGRLFYHAGLIAAAAGDDARAREWFAAAKQAEQTLLPSERASLALRLAGASAS